MQWPQVGSSRSCDKFWQIRSEQIACIIISCVIASLRSFYCIIHCMSCQRWLISVLCDVIRQGLNVCLLFIFDIDIFYAVNIGNLMHYVVWKINNCKEWVILKAMLFSRTLCCLFFSFSSRLEKRKCFISWGAKFKQSKFLTIYCVITKKKKKKKMGKIFLQMSKFLCNALSKFLIFGPLSFFIMLVLFDTYSFKFGIKCVTV